MEVAAFWLAVAAVIITAGWFKSKGEAQKHQTFRTIIEKTGTVDEAQLKLLIPPQSPNPFRNAPGAGYRALRVSGAILMFVGGAGLLFGGILLSGLIFDPAQGRGDGVGIFTALGVAALNFGAGLFYSSRFAEKPAAESERPGARSHKE
jgi:hypothetical protein